MRSCSSATTKQWGLVVSYRRFGTTFNSLTLEDGTDRMLRNFGS